MSEKKKLNDIPEIEETAAVTHDSEPVSYDEMQRLQEDFYTDDLSGGLQNVQVSEEELERQREQYEYAQSFIDIKDVGNTPCFRTDQVHLKLTPEQLVVLKEALEALSLDMTELEYLTEEKCMEYMYQQQSYIRMLHDITDDTLNEYVRHRPYSPFLPTWFKKIGKDELEKDI